MLACRPVEWPTEGPLAKHEPSNIYPGSVVQKCHDCGTEVYVGPKQQEFLSTAPPGWPVYCFLCAVKHADKDAFVADLGNPHLPE